jgi:hypothetical protein
MSQRANNKAELKETEAKKNISTWNTTTQPIMYDLAPFSISSSNLSTNNREKTIPYKNNKRGIHRNTSAS